MNVSKLQKTAFIIAIKITFTLLAFFIISKRISHLPIFTLDKTCITHLLIALILFPIMLILQAWRWCFILLIYDVKTKFKQSLFALWFGHFINNFFPTGTAGDLIRNYSLKSTMGKWRWLNSFLSEKYSAAVSALLLARLALTTSIAHNVPNYLIIALEILLLIIIILPFFFSLTLKFVNFNSKFSILLLEASNALVNIFTRKYGLISFLISFFVNLLMIIIFYVIATGFKININLYECLFVVPIFIFLTALPISYAGWGIREISCVELLHFFGISSEAALLASVSYGLLTMLSALPGIFLAYPFYLSHKHSALSNPKFSDM